MRAMSEAPASSRPADLLRAALVARRHFLDGRTKVEIAEELGVSRFKVARLLDLALREGIVRIEIVPPFGVDAELGQRLADAYGLDEAWVLDAGDAGEEDLRKELGRLGALMLADLIAPGDVLGVAWGGTMRALVDALPPLPECTVVQVAGGLPGGAHDSSLELVLRVAARTSGEVYQLHAPLYVADPATAASLRGEPQIARTLAMFSRLTTVAMGLGPWDRRSPVAAVLTPGDLDLLEGAGVVAEVCGLFVASDGTVIDGGLARRAMTVTLEQLRATPNVLGVAGGRRKAAAFQAVLAAGILTRVVTDRAAAGAALAAAPRARPRPRRPRR